MIGDGWATSFIVKPHAADGRHWGGQKYRFGDELKLSPKRNNYHNLMLTNEAAKSLTLDTKIRLTTQPARNCPY
jgi:hypothetical protein